MSPSIVAGQGDRGPSVMRYVRVQTILESDPAFQDRLGPKDQEIVKRNGEAQRFSKAVIDVTNKLHADGYDAHNAPKPLVLLTANKLLLRAPKPTSEPAPKEETAETEEKPCPKTKTRAKTKAKTKAKRVTRKKLEVTAPPAPPSPTAPPSSPAPVAAPVPVAAKPAETPAPGNNTMPTIYPFLSVLALLHSAYNILQLLDREPGAEHRQEKLSEQMEEMYKLRDVPVPVPVNTLPPSMRHG